MLAIASLACAGTCEPVHGALASAAPRDASEASLLRLLPRSPSDHTRTLLNLPACCCRCRPRRLKPPPRAAATHRCCRLASASVCCAGGDGCTGASEGEQRPKHQLQDQLQARERVPAPPRRFFCKVVGRRQRTRNTSNQHNLRLPRVSGGLCVCTGVRVCGAVMVGCLGCEQALSASLEPACLLGQKRRRSHMPDVTLFEPPNTF